MKIRTSLTRSNRLNESRKRRKGAIAAMTAFLLLAILGLIACALDIGWIAMTHTQLQAVADASSLAGGTELIDGLGYFKTKTPEEVVDAATPIAVEYAGHNRNAELAASFIDGDRDVKFGKATFDVDCGCWQKTPASENPAYYNYVEVTTLRNQTGSSDGDRPVPLFFGRILGFDETSLRATATAAILPANGFRVTEGSDDEANVMPFAFKEALWERFERAQEYYDNNPGAMSNPMVVNDENGPYPTEPLFGALEQVGTVVDPVTGVASPVYAPRQLFFDDHTRTESGAVSSGGDGRLEANIYPRNLKVGEETTGNFGTVDFGAGSNSTNDLKRQIRDGLNADDFSYFENNQITLSALDPLDVEGDTGVSGGIKGALSSVVGECKAIALFTTAEGPGNNAVFELVKFVSATVVRVNFSGSNKELRVQRCRLIDDNAVPDTDNEITDDTTIFTSLILIQ